MFCCGVVAVMVTAFLYKSIEFDMEYCFKNGLCKNAVNIGAFGD
jgi:hypothetical protein